MRPLSWRRYKRYIPLHAPAVLEADDSLLCVPHQLLALHTCVTCVTQDSDEDWVDSKDAREQLPAVARKATRGSIAAAAEATPAADGGEVPLPLRKPRRSVAVSSVAEPPPAAATEAAPSVVSANKAASLLADIRAERQPAADKAADADKPIDKSVKPVTSTRPAAKAAPSGVPVKQVDLLPGGAREPSAPRPVLGQLSGSHSNERVAPADKENGAVRKEPQKRRLYSANDKPTAML